MIIGVTGTPGSGKTTIVRILKEHGFKEFSLSDAIREEAVQRGLMEWGKEERSVLINLGNELRKEHGPGILMERTLAKTNDAENFVIDSVRNPGEVEAMRAANHETLLIAADADSRLRYERLTARASSAERQERVKTYEEFLAEEQVERSDDPHKQQLHRILNMADIVFLNNGTPAELEAKITRAFKHILK